MPSDLLLSYLYPRELLAFKAGNNYLAGSYPDSSVNS